MELRNRPRGLWYHKISFMQYWRGLRQHTRGYDLSILIGITVLATLSYFPLDPGSLLTDIPEILIPLELSVGLVLFTIWLRHKNLSSMEIRRIIKYGWSGALISAAVGGGWLILHLLRDLPASSLANEVLTVWGLGVSAGIFIGVSKGRQQHHIPRENHLLLEEMTWINRPESNPILHAIIELLMDLEGVDPLELDPLYNYLNPDAFKELRAQEDSHWQVTFYIDDYEVKVSSQGAVSVYGSQSLEQPIQNPRPR